MQMKYGNQKLVWFVAKTDICNGEASVSARAIAANGWEAVWVDNLMSPDIQYFSTEEEARKVAYGTGWANSDMTVHGRWIYEEV